MSLGCLKLILSGLAINPTAGWLPVRCMLMKYLK